MEQSETLPTRGFLLSLEGIEGGGKSSNVEFIADWFRAQGRTVLTSREPGGTAIGDHIRRILLCEDSKGLHRDTELLLLCAARAQHCHERLWPALDAGKVVITDRFSDASLAYQGAGRGVGLERVRALQEWTLADFKPQLTLLFDVDAKCGLQRVVQRGETDRFEGEGGDFFQAVRRCYRELAEQEPERFRVVDANRTLPEVRETLRDILSGVQLDAG